MNKPVIRLPIRGAENVRDIGGYVGDENRVGNFGKFVRANYLKNITLEDNNYLKEFGITDILDLRGEAESILEPDSIDKEYFKYYRVGLLTNKFNENLMLEKENFDMGEGYVYY
jgi:protein-tyrosine phosphatase